MKNNKNVLLSLGSFIAAPVWYILILYIGKLFLISPTQSSISSSVGGALVLCPYFIFLAIGIFFGWKNIKSEKPSFLGNLITLIGVLMLLVSVYIFGLAAAWH